MGSLQESYLRDPIFIGDFQTETATLQDPRRHGLGDLDAFLACAQDGEGSKHRPEHVNLADGNDPDPNGISWDDHLAVVMWCDSHNHADHNLPSVGLSRAQ